MSLADPANLIFSLAFDFINSTSRSVFLTGKAGTGKTTFLKYVCGNTHKNFAVAAPTGVAAINAGGMTLHSLFQLPFGIYLSGYHSQESSVPITNKNTLFKNLRLSNNKRELLQELDLLIIDEVSMVRCDTLDAIDTILRAVRKNHKPFGGVQVLFIGDLFQLSPVAVPQEWNILKDHYESPFFFHSNVVKQAAPLCIELTKIYRQNEQVFIDLLNNIRNDEMTGNDLELLNSRQVEIADTDGFITLTTHNHKADAINERELSKLPGQNFRFRAIINEDFPERNYPTEPTLDLKNGAKIMFIKNDSSEEKKYYNGKIATVTDLDESSVTVKFDNGDLFELTKETWRNIRYTYNAEEDEVEEEELGAFVQYPIRLAWAITIHKSQGLTFERAIIDAGSSFAAGQVYVALSRCTSLQGLVLQSSITNKQVVTDPLVLAYSQQLKNELELKSELQKEREQFEKEYFIKLLNFNRLSQTILDWIKEVPGKKLPAMHEVIALTKELEEKTNELITVSEKTQQWIEFNFNESRNNQSYDKLTDGLKRSVLHFNMRLHELYGKLHTHYTSLSGKSKVKKYRSEVKEVLVVISAKAKKIRDAVWMENRLFVDDGRIFENLHQVAEAKTKVGSALETFALIQRELSIEKIASMRGLAQSTIESHVLEFIKSGKLSVEKIVVPEKVTVISETISKSGLQKASELKNVLGNDYSYNEIRAVLYHLKQEEKPE